MASSNHFFAGVKNAASKAKNYIFDAFRPAEEEDILGEDEVYEAEEYETEPAVFMSAEPEYDDADRQDDSQYEINDDLYAKAGEEPEEEYYPTGRSFLYAHQNDYTGRRSYDDNSSVAFSLASNTSFGSRRPEPETIPAPSSSVIFGSRPSESTFSGSKPLSASATGSTFSDRAALSEVDFSYSGAKEPVTFGSRPVTRYDAAPATPDVEQNNTGDDVKTVKAKAVVGFNTTGSTGSSSSATGYTSQRNTRYGGVAMDNLTVQVLKPTEISEATAAGSLLKKGVVVICNLSEIPDKNTRIRFSDFLCGCCKGCDADFSEIISVESSNAVLIAVPSNVTLKNAAPAPKAEEKPQSAPIDIPAPDMSDIFSYTPTETPRANSYFDIDF